ADRAGGGVARLLRAAASRPRHSARARPAVRRSARPHHRARRSAEDAHQRAMSELHLPHGAHAESPRVDSPDVRHEESDVNIRAIFGFGIGLAVAGIVISFVVWLLFQYFEARESRKVTPEFPLAAQQENRLPPEPRLQTNPRADLRSEERRVGKTRGPRGSRT